MSGSTTKHNQHQIMENTQTNKYLRHNTISYMLKICPMLSGNGGGYERLGKYTLKIGIHIDRL